MSFSRRRYDLLRVLAIESEIKDIEHGQKYLRFKREITVLENARRGSGSLRVSNPEDMDSIIELRRNSAGVEEYLAKYRMMMHGVREKMDRLNAEKLRLKAELSAT